LSSLRGGLPPVWNDRNGVIDNVANLTQSLDQAAYVAVILNDLIEKITRHGKPYWLLDVWVGGSFVPCFWWHDQNRPFDPRLPTLNPGQRLLLWAVPQDRNGALQLNVQSLLDIA